MTFSMNQATDNGGTCFGDSGGPHFLGDVVVAVTVTGDSMCKATDKAYRVDTPWALDFLSEFLPDECARCHTPLVPLTRAYAEALSMVEEAQISEAGRCRS